VQNYSQTYAPTRRFEKKKEKRPLNFKPIFYKNIYSARFKSAFLKKRTQKKRKRYFFSYQFYTFSSKKIIIFAKILTKDNRPLLFKQIVNLKS